MNNNEYNSKNEWILQKARRMIPPEIISFMENVFQIYEIRERVGAVRGIRFEVRTRENNHNRPHVHAEYDKYSVVVDIENAEVIDGNLPKSQRRIAEAWVKDNQDMLLEKWNNIAITAVSKMTKSSLG